jgi:hypothetical protein
LILGDLIQEGWKKKQEPWVGIIHPLGIVNACKYKSLHITHIGDSNHVHNNVPQIASKIEQIHIGNFNQIKKIEIPVTFIHSFKLIPKHTKSKHNDK